MIDPITVLGEAAAVIDPRGENEDISILCGLVAWAIKHPVEYHGWDAKSLSAALCWNSEGDPEGVDEIVRHLVSDHDPFDSQPT